MSHHYSGPDFGFPHGDARLDFSDLYAFPKPGEAGKSILIMNVHPSVGVNPPGPTTAEPSAPKRYMSSRLTLMAMPSAISHTCLLYTSDVYKRQQQYQWMRPERLAKVFGIGHDRVLQARWEPNVRQSRHGPHSLLRHVGHDRERGRERQQEGLLGHQYRRAGCRKPGERPIVEQQ